MGKILICLSEEGTEWVVVKVGGKANWSNILFQIVNNIRPIIEMSCLVILNSRYYDIFAPIYWVRFFLLPKPPITPFALIG